MADTGQSDREYYRARATLAVRYGPDTPEGRRIMAMDRDLWDTQSGLEETARQILDTGDLPDNLKPLLPLMRWLNFKMDLVLHHLRQRELGVHFPKEGNTTDLSGSGLGLENAPEVRVGDTLILAFTLPQNPSRPVYAVGEVVRLAQSPPNAAVTFREIAESDRERIIRYTFRQQRKELAQRMQKE